MTKGRPYTKTLLLNSSTAGLDVHVYEKDLSVSANAQVLYTDNNHQKHNEQCPHASIIQKIYGQMLMCQQPGYPPSLFSLIPHALYC